MMGRRLTVLLLFVCVLAVRGQWQLTDYSIENSLQQLNFSRDFDTTTSSFTLFNCFGAFDLYYGNNPPTVGSPNKVAYNPSTSSSTFGFPGFTGTVYLLGNCLTTQAGNPFCANFTLVQHGSDQDVSQFFVKTPTSGGSVRGKVDKGGKSGSVTWDVVNPGNQQETYDLYWANTQTAPSGQSFSTACSVRSWMNRFTAAQGTVKNNGDGTWTAEVVNLDRDTPFTVVILANRANSISGVYNSIALNGKDTVSTTSSSSHTTICLLSCLLLVIFVIA